MAGGLPLLAALLILIDVIPTEGALSFRALCERVGGTNSNSKP